MRKKVLLYLTIIAIMLFLPFIEANAAGSVVCSSNGYYIRGAGDTYVGNASGNYKMRFYNTYNDNGSLAGYTYCLHPGLKSPRNMTQRCARRIEPSSSAEGLGTQAYDVAIQKAYEILLSEGLINDSVNSRVIGEMVFRFISYNYGRPGVESAINWSGETGDAVRMFRIANIAKWRDERATRAIDIFMRAIAVGNKILSGVTYDELVKTGEIWGPDYEVSGSTMTPELMNTYKIVGDSMAYFMFEIRANYPPQETYWDKFTVSCANGYECSIVKPGETTVSTDGKVIVRVNPASGNGSGEYGITLHSSYYDKKSAAANIIETQGPNSAYQHMIIITPGEPNIKMNTGSGSDDSPSGGTPVHPPLDICVCDPATGEFKDTKTKNTCNVKTSADKCESFKQTYKCSVPSDNPNCESKKCVKDPNTNKCYGPDGKEITCDKYEELCEYKCSDTYENYCPGDGITPSKDGKIKTSCSEAVWTKICLCEKEPNNPKCANCNAAVNMVGDCADLTTDNVETEYTGAISDVNEKDNTGAYIASCRTRDVDKDPIKACVAHDLAVDQAGNNYKSTNTCDETNTQTLLSNPYCSVYCKEQYNFTTPTAQLVKSGGYFTISTVISGKRTCYAAGANNNGESTPINYVQFKTDFDSAQIDVINAWNEYNHWRVAAATPYDIKSGSDTAPGGRYCSGGSTTHWKTVNKSWNYTKYDYLGNPSSASDSYSDGHVTSCGTCTCMADSIGVEANPSHEALRDAARKKLEAAIANLEKIITYYNSCTVSVENQISDINNTKSVSKTWKNDMKYDPVVEFDYYEKYPTEGKFLKENEQIKEITRYYVNDPGNDYDVNNNKGVTDLTYRTDVWFVQCNDAECHHDASFKLSAPLWMKIEKEILATFNSPVNYSTYTPYGTVRAQNGDGKNWLELESNSKPVELIRETGVYPFRFTYSNIGMSNQDCSTGRIIATGSAKSVLTEYNKLKDDDKCNAKGSDGKQTMTQEVGYVCHYIVNCPQCEFKCKDGKCEIVTEDPPVCEDDRCQFKCKHCIFSPSNSYTFRTVSLTNMFPNKRTTETNWADSDPESKAYKTLERIQSSKTTDSGEEVYNTPQYSYTLTPNNMAKIREFNNEVGSYLNTKMPNGDDVLNCENSGDIVSVRCTSAFLDMLDKDKSYATVNKRVTKDKDAFQLWSKDVAFNSGVGPAWYIKDGD